MAEVSVLESAKRVYDFYDGDNAGDFSNHEQDCVACAKYVMQNFVSVTNNEDKLLRDKECEIEDLNAQLAKKDEMLKVAREALKNCICEDNQDALEKLNE